MDQAPLQTNHNPNLAERVVDQARQNPDQLALVVAVLHGEGSAYTEERLTFGELGQRIASFQAGLEAHGFKAGDRMILMAPLSLDLYALLLALFASGLSAVLIDAGMPRAKIVQAIRDAKAQAILSVGALLRFRWLIPALWGLRCFSVDSKGFGVRPSRLLFRETGAEPTVRKTLADDHALITFTSGSTGRPKGADRTHGLLTAQHLALAEHFPNRGGEIDMPCFPVVTLHNLCCGIPTILPAVDFKAPGSVHAPFLVEQIQRWGINQMSGAPAYIERLVEHLEAKDQRNHSIKRMAVGGAPVPMHLCRRILERFPACEAQVVYGSTEAEPIASVSMVEVLSERERAVDLGLLVGSVAHVADVALVHLPSDPVDLGADGIDPYRVEQGMSGELVVSGPHVNRSYLDNPNANRANKIYAEDGTVWHRTGDVACFDEHQRIWLQGRVKDLVQHRGVAVQPLPIEAALDDLDGVTRSALIQGTVAGSAILVLELSTHQVPQESIHKVLKRYRLDEVPLVVRQKIPMDYRHQSKIDRVGLRASLRD